jgi:hypothetical protein
MMCVYFAGIISLTSIDFVNIRDEIMMKAVGRMCPYLKEVTFSELLHTDAITPDQLYCILTTEWPKVKCFKSFFNDHINPIYIILISLFA